jgi:hypothetical protein
MDERPDEIPAFACCSIGIGRWFWVAWASEAEAKAAGKPIASGYEKSAAHAEEKAIERLGSEVRRLPAKWAAAHKGGGSMAARAPGAKRRPADGEDRPGSRLGRPKAPLKRGDAPPRLAFLYSATARELPDSLGEVSVTRHRIFKQTASKVYVEREPFDEGEWARRSEQETGAPGPRTVAVDRALLRKEGRFRAGRSHGGLTFYASEEAGIRDVEAALTARHAWCAVLGVRLPCSAADVRAAYRRLAFDTHPDRGGDPAGFRAIEQAYRSAMTYFGQR